MAVICCSAHEPRPVRVQEGIELRFQHLNTTSFALSGDYRPDSDE